MKLGKKKQVTDAAQISARHYDVIRTPVVTEKSTAASEFSKVVFNVARDADKSEIKSAVEALFKVKVVKVNTLNRKGKTKTFRGRPGRQSDVKKATVTLEAGQTIDLGVGVK